ncbi:MAG: hypothetical protein NHB32_08430 [Fischerella sp. CENA71]|nr:hypothetical protein [Fischerella sp. CENA71]
MSDLTVSKRNLFAIDGNKGSLSDYQLPKNVVSCQSIIPAPVQQILATQFKSVGLNFDITKLALNKDNRQLLKELKTTIDLITNNAKLLPQFAAELKKAMKAATKMAEFNADVVKASLKEQHKIDSAQADILLALAGYVHKRDRLALKLERKLQKLARVHAAQARHYDTTYGKEAELLDAQFDFVTDAALAATETKRLTAQASRDRKVKNQQWTRGAI